MSIKSINNWPFSGSSVDLGGMSFCFALLFRTDEFLSVVDGGCLDVGFLVYKKKQLLSNEAIWTAEVTRGSECVQHITSNRARANLSSGESSAPR